MLIDIVRIRRAPLTRTQKVHQTDVLVPRQAVSEENDIPFRWRSEDCESIGVRMVYDSTGKELSEMERHRTDLF